ncbi:MAG: hypothetical protein ACKOYN_11380, partial [Planctomycetota bacterium]
MRLETLRFPALRGCAALILSVLALAGVRSAAAQSCALYQTDFGSFSGPPDLTSGEFRVRWCVSGATIASSGFCPTGSGLRLAGSTQDPVILVSGGGAGCSAFEVSFTYAQFSASGTVVKYGTTQAVDANCTASTPVTALALTATGGACTTASFTVPLLGASGAYIRFDHGANTNAVVIDDLVIRRVGCCGGSSHSCCEAGSAGCADSAVSACVCAADPYCCSTEWDAQCVAEVESLGCGSCGGGGAACLGAFAADFGTLYSGGSICTKYPALFERCEGSAPFLTSSLGCAGSGDMALRFAQGFPYSAAVTRCIGFAARQAPALRFSYSKQSGTLGPRIDVSLDGTSWSNAWTAPVSFGGGCEERLLDLAPLAGEAAVWLRFSSGSSTSNLAAFDDFELIELDTTPHGCCEEGGPSCDDAATSACTCALDAYCCESAWDVLCMAIATVHCGASCPGLPVCGSPTAGECGSAHATPACADAECCLAVCD